MLGELALFSTPIGNAPPILYPAHSSVGKFLVCFQLTVPAGAGYSYLTKAIRSDGVEVFRSRHVQREFWKGYFWIELPASFPATGFFWYDQTLGGSGFFTNANTLHYFDPFRKPENWATNSPTVMPATPSSDPADRYTADSSIVVQPEPVFFLVDLKDGQHVRLETTSYRDDPFNAGSTPTLSDTIPTTTDASPSEVVQGTNAGTMQAWMLRI